jgi:hypothetical protein
MKASHREITWETTITGKGSTPVQVGRGRFVFGRNAASKELGMDPSTVYKRMLKLGKLENLNIKSNSHYSVVTIVNWDFYQEEEKKVTGKVTGKCQASNTYKNVKNEKNEIIRAFSFSDIWKLYPERIGKKAAEKHFKVSVKTQEDWNNINLALQNYLKSEKVSKGFIQNGSTWFNNWTDWIDYTGITKPVKDPKNVLT